MVRLMGCMVWALVLVAGLPAQGRAPREVTPARLQKLIHAAMEGSPIVRPQAAERLEGMGPEAHQAVLDFVRSKDDLFAVGPDLLRVAAGLAVPENEGSAESEPLAALRTEFWGHVGERDFPWRAALVTGLAQHPATSERAAFVALLADRLLAVRLAALNAFAAEPAERLLPLLQKRLNLETEGPARRALARRAFEAGHGPALWVLYHELDRSDYFFDQPVGLIARLEASRFLKELFPDGPAFDAQAKVDSPEAQAQRKAWLAYLEPLAGPERRTTQAFESPRGTPVFGLELRSCRRGEFFLRWTDADQLWLGRGRPLCLNLKPGTCEALLLAARGALANLGDQHLTGQPGCDQESYHFHLPESEQASVYLITKGPAPVPNLRPMALNPLLEEWMESLATAALPPGFAQDLQAALVDLGGEYGASAEKSEDK